MKARQTPSIPHSPVFWATLLVGSGAVILLAVFSSATLVIAVIGLLAVASLAMTWEIYRQHWRKAALPSTLYLDTARLGRISSSAQQILLGFVRLAAEEPSSLYFEEFLCMIASRSAELMTLAARVLCKTCRSIFTTDFNWPTYQLILQHEARRSGNPFQVAQLRASVLRHRMPPDELVTRIVREFVSHNCDGLFLPAVDNWGIRLPIWTATPKPSILAPCFPAVAPWKTP